MHDIRQQSFDVSKGQITKKNSTISQGGKVELNRSRPTLLSALHAFISTRGSFQASFPEYGPIVRYLEVKQGSLITTIDILNAVK